MRLYSKKLNSLEELRREKSVLLYAKKLTQADGFFDLKKDVDFRSKAARGNIASFAGNMLGTKSLPLYALQLGFSVYRRLKNKKAQKLQQERKEEGPGIIQAVFAEVILGYVKWKLIEMGYRGARLFFKNRKAKKEAARNAQETSYKKPAYPAGTYARNTR